MNKYQEMLIKRCIAKINQWKNKSQVENKEIYHFFHSLKGTAASIELVELTKLAEKVLNQIDEKAQKNWSRKEWINLVKDLLPILNLSLVEQAETEAGNSDTLDQENRLILLGDDDIDRVTFLKMKLEEQGYMVLVALTAEKALKIFYSQKPDCVILDIQLPDQSGFEVLQSIVNKSYKHFIPVILMSADDKKEIRMKGYKWGASDFIAKPIEIEEFLVRVENRVKQKKLIHSAILIDELTEAFNRKFFYMEMERQIHEFERAKIPFSIVLIDIDYFKKINDTYGHNVGDAVLRELSLFIKQNKRQADFIIRYGGEEFILLLPRTNKDQAKVLTERLLAGFSQKPFFHKGSSFHIAFSAGIVEIYDEKISTEEYVERADQMLYKIKEKGRNGVAVYNAAQKGNTVEKIVRIGVIDDDEIVRQVVVEQLGKVKLLDYQIDIKSFREGESFFQSEWHKQNGKFLIILDGVLPRMDGLEVLQNIRKQFDEKKFMILMLTGRKSERDIVKALELGADDYLTKPFSVAELRARVRRLLLRMV